MRGEEKNMIEILAVVIIILVLPKLLNNEPLTLSLDSIVVPLVIGAGVFTASLATFALIGVIFSLIL